MESDQIDIFAPADTFKQVQDTKKAGFARQFGGDIRREIQFSRIEPTSISPSSIGYLPPTLT